MAASEPKRLKMERPADEINLFHMIESRITELIHIDKECKRKLAKSYYQRLPRFMRRRAASHDVKRLPKKYKASLDDKHGSKNRRPLLKYRRKARFRKHKKILKKSARHVYSNSDKCLLHKWFAKRFKMSHEAETAFLPIHNNTKNQRNLYRHTLYCCAYISMAHLIPLKLELASVRSPAILSSQLEQLNKLTKPGVGFSFCAQAIRAGRYEIQVHLFEPESLVEENMSKREYICTVLVSMRSQQLKLKGSQPTILTMWVSREHRTKIEEMLATLSKGSRKPFTIASLKPCDQMRIRLVGPKARNEIESICDSEKKAFKSALEDADLRLGGALGLNIGRSIKESVHLRFVFFNKCNKTVDVIFRHKAGRMLWYKLIKNKAHLVGGLRDFDRLYRYEEDELYRRMKRLNVFK